MLLCIMVFKGLKTYAAIPANIFLEFSPLVV